MIKYNVRSRQLIDIVGDIKRSQLILSPYFQRNLVWRQVHKQDFIKTILLGYPFPQIFLAKGGIDADAMTSTSLIVDGQQRMKSIIEFIDGGFEVDGKYYVNLSKDEKDELLTYEIAIIELQMESDDPQIKEVFKRLNRTFYSLTNIERLSTEYAPSELMLVAKVLTQEIELKLPRNDHTLDPNIPESFIHWGIKKKVESFNKLILESTIFTNYEISRKVHLMVVLNILATIERGFFNRNIPSTMLEEYSEIFTDKDLIMENLEKSAKLYLDMHLPKESYWYNKANFFSILIYIYNNYDELVSSSTPKFMKEKLLQFEKDLPPQYQLAAKEAVNNKKERQLRNKYLDELFLHPSPAKVVTTQINIF
jgi:hypothetical protein